MFPGSGRHSYGNNQGGYQGGNQYGYQNQQGNYAYPAQGPPPGPPPGNYYGGPPPSQPPQGGYYDNRSSHRPPESAWSPQGGSLNSSQFQQQQMQYQQQQNYVHQQHEPQGNQNALAPNSSYDSLGHYTGDAYQRPVGPPPTAPQSFGQNSNMTFLYSNCTGKKKALLIGINYFGTKNELRGCINDVKNMSSFLNQYYGYSYDDMVILTDDQRDQARIPTRANIIRAMQWLTKNAAPNDSYFFHMSCHGGLVPDQDGDEDDGFDSCVYPLDFETAGPIIDDEMHDLMVKPLPQGCRLVALYDACHSGTALDLPFVYSTKGVVKEPNLWKDAGTDALKAIMNYETGNITGAMSAVSGLFKKVTNHKSTDRNRIIQSKMSAADVISLSGCKDDQTSADATEAGKSTGAMSWAFISVLTQSTNQSYLSLLNNMRTLLSAKYSQKPQLSASHPQDMNLAFIM